MELTAAEIWSRILEDARLALPEQAFRTWLAPTEAIAVSKNQLIISTPNPFAVDWVEDKYAELLTAIAERAFGRRFTLSVRYDGAAADGGRRRGGAGGGLASMSGSASEQAALGGRGQATSPPEFGGERGTSAVQGNGASAGPAFEHAPPHAPSFTPPSMPSAAGTGPGGGARTSAQLNERYTFERFVVGNNNQLAAAAAHAVAEAPARMYNPLFIYGGVGLGKTHLMHAIGHAVLEREPQKQVLYLSSERFTNELVSAIQEGKMAEFRRQYRQIDLLLVDDIQFLEGKERTQEEFFHTFNALHDAQRQIVLTSDRPPKEIGLEDRLISRFEWGLVTDIRAPDFETRMAILRKKIEQDRLAITDAEGVLTFLARNCTSSVRELEGAVIKLLAYSSLTRREIDLALAKEALGGVLRGGGEESGAPGATPDLVRRRVAEAWGVSAESLQSKKRTKDLTVPRQVAMYLIREFFDLPLVEIGKLFGGRDHSTVIHSISKVEEELAVDPAFRQRVETLRAALR